MNKYLILFFLLLPTAYLSSGERPDLEKFFANHGTAGCIIIYNTSADSIITFDSARCKKRFIPASTFKILNSLIALETGIASDEHYKIPWNGRQYPIESWNRDHTLATAIEHSVVWYYQTLARKIGRQRMQAWIDSAAYGNRKISGRIDQFWLRGPLEISAHEQIEFLRKLYNNEMSFSQRNMDIVKKIILVDSTKSYAIRAKTGFSLEQDIGWWVGWVESKDNVYYFAININAPEFSIKYIKAREEITREILQYLNIIE
ncbi:MAG: class D beta-lactamase [Candidatus Kapaibacterium sp.]